MITGTPMADPNEKISFYIKGDTGVLYFKDLGPQVGWKTVFYVEYAGPIVITLLFLVLRLTCWQSDKELTLN